MQRRLRWPLGLAAIGVVAAAARLALLDGPVYGDEGVHFAVARHWGADPDNVVPAYRMNGWLWVQRPLFSLLLAPGAALGLAAYRVEHALLACLVPVLGASLVRAAGARPGLAVGAGVVLAIEPLFVLWGARAFPDSLMTVLALAGLRLHVARRPAAAAATLLAAVWVKESASVLLVGLLAWSLLQAWRNREASLWPLRLDRRATALLGACLLAPWPLALGLLRLEGRMPGWSTTPFGLGETGGLFVTAWLLLPILAGLAWTKSRPWCLLALLYPAFYLTYARLGHGVEAWYLVLPAALAVVAAAIALDQAAGHARPAIRSAGRVAVPATALLLALVAFVPAAWPGKAWVTPGVGPQASLPELGAGLQGDDLADAVAALQPDHWEVVFLVDVGWFHVHEPFATRAGAVGWSYTGVDIPLGEWTYAVENTNVTVLYKVERAVNLALRETYADCVLYENTSYVLIEGGSCTGRESMFRSAVEGHRA